MARKDYWGNPCHQKPRGVQPAIVLYRGTMHCLIQALFAGFGTLWQHTLNAMDMNIRHIEAAGPLADALLDELAELPTGVATAALAMALGYLAERRGVTLRSVEEVMRASYGATRAEAA